jgi:hypothetical protein
LISNQAAFSETSGRAGAVSRHPGLCVEARLLLCAASPVQEVQRLSEVRSLIEHPIDWDRLLGMGAQNEILPLLYWHLNAACPDRVPPAVMRRLRDFFFQTSVRNLSLLKELLRLLARLSEQGIEAIPYKGPALARSLYGNVAFRRTMDIDILVRRDAVDETRQLLIRDGYTLATEMNDEQMIAHRDSHYHLEFRRKEDDIRVEVHWEFLPKDCGHFDTSYVWDRLVTEDLGGQPVLSMRPEELFVLLCVHHGSKHEWDRLKWIADIGRMIEAHPDLDWMAVVARARSFRQERAVLLGCFLSAYLLGITLPRKILSAVKNSPFLPARAALIRGRLFRANRGLPGYREWCVYVDALSGPFVARPGLFRCPRNLQYALAVMTPEFGDRYNLRLPAWFSFVHYLYRPVRLWERHGTALFKRLN